MSRDYVIIDHVQGGQPRPYADSVYSAYISLRREGVLLNNQKFYIELTEQKVRELARLLIHDFKDNPEHLGHAQLVECRAVEPTTEMTEETGGQYSKDWKPKDRARWFVKIVQPYTD